MKPKKQAKKSHPVDGTGEAAGETPDGAGEAEQTATQDPREARIAALQTELDDQRDRHLRAVAELDNYRKRLQKERPQLREQGTAELAGRILDVLDNLERALQAVPEEEASAPLAEGVRMVHGQFLTALKSTGIEPLEPVGQPFDPHFHEALMEEERDDVAPGTVIDELTRGYRIGERLLRASQVRVARAPAARAPDSNDTPDPTAADEKSGGRGEDTAEPAR